MRITTPYKSNLELSVCLSLLTAQPLEMNDIGIAEGGLTSSQISFLKLLEKITDGATYTINETGCRLRVIPGTLIGGEIDHDCDPESAIGYYAMYLILLAPFCQKPIEANLHGVTNREGNISAELLNYGLVDILKDIVGEVSMFEMVVKQRGCYPDGGGLVIFKARPVQYLKPLERLSVGKLQKIRGISWSTRVNPTLAKREIDGAKQAMTKYLSDVYILNDHKKGQDAGLSPGYGIVLTAISTTGVAYVVEKACRSRDEIGNVATSPEELGQEAAALLGRQIVRGGAVAAQLEPLVLAMMALGRKNVSKVILGVPGPASIQAARDIHAFTNVRFNIEPVRPGMVGYREEGGQQLVFSCLGSGSVNLNRQIR